MVPSIFRKGPCFQNKTGGVGFGGGGGGGGGGVATDPEEGGGGGGGGGAGALASTQKTTDTQSVPLPSLTSPVPIAVHWLALMIDQ